MKKSVISLITASAVVLSMGLAACKGGAHDEHDWVVDTTTATCGEAGETTYVCSGCDETKTETTPATGKHNFEGDVCKDCGYIKFGSDSAAAIAEYGYYVEDKDNSNTYTTGDIVYFGSYPQTLDEDAGKSEAQLLGELPTAENANGWTSYGYYDGGEQSDYMFYKDVESGSDKWRVVYMLDYRPYYSGLEAGTEYSYIDDEGYELNTAYWFKYEPVKWTVLEYKDGNMFLSSKYSIDAQPFQDTYEGNAEKMVIPGTETYINDWEASSMRRFLNETFYNTAFSDAQKALVQTTPLDNKTTGYSATAEYQINQRNTEDKVFLLSYQDLSNRDYGYTGKGESKAHSYSDYAIIQGNRTSTQGSTADGEPASTYWIRSAGDKSYAACSVSKLGAPSYAATGATIENESNDLYAFNGDLGTLPALNIRVGKTAQGVWKNYTKVYTNADGDEAELEYSVLIPASYKGGDKLPLITAIPDSSYVGAYMTKYQSSECILNWTSGNKMSENPAFFLTFRFTDADSDITKGGNEVSQVVSIIDKVVEEYGLDVDRLYLTGQSMGGIMDFAINNAYPDKFAATVYVGCQPGDEVSTADAPVAMYDEIIAAAKFVNQKFVYIASRKDGKAPYGQDDVEAALREHGVTDYVKLYGLDHEGGAALEAAVKAELNKGLAHNFFGFEQVTSNGNPINEHNKSFEPAYEIDAIFEWLLAQHK